MAQEKSAGAIIFRRDEGVIYYLLLHYPAINRRGGHWEFAKGHIEEGENYETTVRREVFEETGIKDLRILPGFKEHIKYFFRRKPEELSMPGAKGKSPWIFKLVTFFAAETRQRDVRISPEHTGFIWLPIDEAVKKTTYKNSKELLKRAHEFILQAKSVNGGKKNQKGPDVNV